LPQSSEPKIEPITGAEIREVRTSDGQISVYNWSWLTLDTADELARLGGRNTLEFYYRTAQQVEAFSTNMLDYRATPYHHVMYYHYIELSQWQALVFHYKLGVYIAPSDIITPPPKWRKE